MSGCAHCGAAPAPFVCSLCSLPFCDMACSRASTALAHEFPCRCRYWTKFAHPSPGLLAYIRGGPGAFILAERAMAREISPLLLFDQMRGMVVVDIVRLLRDERFDRFFDICIVYLGIARAARDPLRYEGLFHVVTAAAKIRGAWGRRRARQFSTMMATVPTERHAHVLQLLVGNLANPEGPNLDGEAMVIAWQRFPNLGPTDLREFVEKMRAAV